VRTSKGASFCSSVNTALGCWVARCVSTSPLLGSGGRPWPPRPGGGGVGKDGIGHRIWCQMGLGTGSVPAASLSGAVGGRRCLGGRGHHGRGGDGVECGSRSGGLTGRSGSWTGPKGSLMGEERKLGSTKPEIQWKAPPRLTGEGNLPPSAMSASQSVKPRIVGSSEGPSVHSRRRAAVSAPRLSLGTAVGKITGVSAGVARRKSPACCHRGPALCVVEGGHDDSRERHGRQSDGVRCGSRGSTGRPH